MHELSLTGSILEIIEDYAKKRHFEKVNSVKLSFGSLSCIDPGSLRFAFEVLSAETRAHGATLEFDILPVVIFCTSCEKETEVDSFAARCPLCGGTDVILTEGTQELKVVELDVD